MVAGGTLRGPALKIRRVHHAGTSSGIADGAAALLLASAVKRVSMGSSRARVVATANVERI